MATMIQFTKLLLAKVGGLLPAQGRRGLFMTTCTSQSLSDTSSLALEILEQFSGAPRIHTATVLALSGDLGAGKTAFTQMCAKHLGIEDVVVSPTFVIAKFYSIEREQFPWNRLIHIDAYRLESWQELQALGFDEIFTDPNNLVIIEWPEQVADTDQADWARINISTEQEKRVFTIE